MYTIKLLKQNFVNLVISSFERPEGFKIESIDKEITKEDVKKGLSESTKKFPPIKEALDSSKEERTNLSNEKLQNISNREFLAISPARRLENITKNNIKSEKVFDGTQKSLEFSFTFDGKFNKELYLKTTAGQVLPKEVSVVEKDGMTYERKNLSGEFFTSGNKRLIIKEGTKINIEKIRTPEEIKKIEEDNNKEVSKFKGSPDYKTGFDDVALEAIKRGVDPKFALLAFEERVSKTKNIFERSVLIEEMFTQYDRKKGKIDSAFKNRQEAIQISILKEFSGNWKEKAKEYGIKEEVIESIVSSNSGMNLDFKKISGGDLSKVDFRSLKSRYPREASIKNNNPAGLTWNNTFANTLRSHGISFYKGTSRPSREGGSYFGFENMEEGMNAYNLLWEIKLRKNGNKTFGDFAKKWAVDYSSYKSQFGNIWNQKLSSLDENHINIIKSKQMRIESPGMYKELSKLGVV